MDITSRTNYVDCYYLISDFILIFMFLRLFFVIRAIFNYNIFTDVYAKKLCRSYGFTAGQRFTFKSILKTKPEMTVSVMFIISIFMFAYLIRITEQPYYNALGQHDFDRYFQGIWCIVITMTTVGYGDLTPATDFGRVIMMFVALWGTFLISLLILIASDIFAMTINE